MKKSNLILLILILSIPVALLAHQLSLRAAYQSGQIVSNNFTPPAPVEYIYLPAFTNLVVNGAVQQPAGDSAAIPDMYVQLMVSEGAANILTIRKDLQGLLRWEVKHDTLFCHFASNGKQQLKPFIPHDVRIQVSRISNIRVDRARLNFLVVAQEAPLSVTLNRVGTVGMDGLQVPFIYVYADNSELYINSGTVDLLRYTAAGGAKVVTAPDVKIGKLEDVTPLPIQR